MVVFGRSVVYGKSAKKSIESIHCVKSIIQQSMLEARMLLVHTTKFFIEL